MAEQMEMDAVGRTLFIPMQGRALVATRYPWVLRDERAVAIARALPAEMMLPAGQTEYSLLAGAVRSVNMDRYTRAFLSAHPDGCVIALGCGLETSFFRCDNGRALFFELDLAGVAALRQRVIGESERDRIVACSMFETSWMREVRAAHPGPYFLIASGVFYYFHREEIVALLTSLSRELPQAEIAFDAVSHIGLSLLNRVHMKKLGHGDAAMYFSLAHAKDLAAEVAGASVLDECDYFAHVSRRGLKLMTRLSMAVSDLFHMVKMIRLKLN